MNAPFDDTDMPEPPPAEVSEAITVLPEDRPCFRCFSDWVRIDGKPYAPGVWHFSTKETKDNVLLTQTYICSPLEIEAISCDRNQHNFGRLIRIRNTLGRWREWAMPMELLSGSSEAMHKELLAMGVTISPTASMQLKQYFAQTKPERTVTCAIQTGWTNGPGGDCFVLPDAVVGPGSQDIIYQSTDRPGDEYATAGTLDTWRSGIARAAAGNPLLVLALSAAFAGPLLYLTGAEGGGLHFVGDSSTGKTTLLEVACSVWGGKAYKRSWRTTANGMEGAAALFNDSLLALDEISECDPREVGAIVYALANGVGKQRATRAGTARAPARWRCVVLSSGERSIATSMSEGGYRIKAGQSIRILDVPCNRRFGAFDTLDTGQKQPKTNAAALADAFKRAAAAHHGTAGRALLRGLAEAERDWRNELEEWKKHPFLSCAEDAEGQDRRVSARFALFAMAGELATEFGITGWAEGTAIAAAKVGLQAWRAGRLAPINNERGGIVEQLAGFVDRHGDSRFCGLDASASVSAMVRDRAGWWEHDVALDQRIYWFTGEGLRDALKGLDFNRSIDALRAAGVLMAGEDRAAVVKKINGRPMRLYKVNPAKFL